MAIDRKTGLICLLAIFLLFTQTYAKKGEAIGVGFDDAAGAAQIGRGINDLIKLVRQGRSETLPHLVRECYGKLAPSGTADNIA
jgi:hypothetical protein